ncbi:hypothetical protein P167DRAFT_537259 [Morchella conica CCBAS932]|uniref:Uncharacterized protein n=1 Tax=Morchella conica CCBAS932 TaxID=1392247 RepID=A0A3N4KK92_9PEZI|nr:hypothetical protein P167DRAFT_537259 [Morchella conica CCBAS932]
MQYRTSALVALFSATTALAYLDCGGGRAPPKTTVPGCPGYVDPATVVPTSTVAPTSSIEYNNYNTDDTSNYSFEYGTITAEGSVVTDQPEVGAAANEYYSLYVDPDAVSGCNCRGYLCQYATPGCVNLDASSTITANPGWETKTFDEDAYSSYIKTASSPNGELSLDGYRIELITPVPSASGYADSTTTKTGKASTTATGSGSATGAAVTTMATSTFAASSSQAASNSSSNGTLSSTDTIITNTNSASTISGMTSLVALLITGAAAIVML